MNIKCKICGGEVNEEDLCSGCNELICEKCDDGLHSPWGNHRWEEHTDTKN